MQSSLKISTMAIICFFKGRSCHAKKPPPPTHSPFFAKVPNKNTPTNLTA
ncbi:hypothetical protein [Moraxella lacunata]